MCAAISEAKIRTALKRLSSDQLVLELRKNPSNSENGRALLDLLQRSNELFFKYPNPNREKLRDDLFQALRRYFDENFDRELQRAFSDLVSLVGRVELGYRKILSLLEKLPIRRRT